MRRRARAAAVAALALLALTALGALLAGGVATVPEEGPPEAADAGAGDAADLAEGLLEGAPRKSYESALPLEEEAALLLEERRGDGDCLVARSGFLDLAGRTWGCVLQGSGWVEICLVSEKDDAGCAVSVWRLSADDVERALGGDG